MPEKYTVIKKDKSPESGTGKVRALSSNVYTDAIEAKARGELVCWSASNFPAEILQTFQISTVYPESQAAAIGARHAAQELCEQSEAAGYSNDLCAYARINLAFAKNGKCEAQPMPLPDFLACCNNICDCMFKWYENLAVELNVPLVILDIPFNPDYDVSEAQLKYMRAQFYDCIAQIEKITGKKWDQARFEEIMKNVKAASQAWVKACEYSNNMPALFNGSDIVSNMGGMVTGRCYPAAAEAYNALCSEYQKMLDNGETTFKGDEKYRVMMEGISVWPYLRYIVDALAAEGINTTSYVYGNYTHRIYDSLDEMLITYASVWNSVCIERAVDNRLAIAKPNHIDGILVHTNRSCKMWSGIQAEVTRRVAEACDVPLAVYDGDQADPRNFSEAQFETRLQGLVEIMDANKKAKEGQKDE